MPKLYEYFGLIVMFYANEHEPVHVHGKCQGRETRAEIILLPLSNFEWVARRRFLALRWGQGRA